MTTWPDTLTPAAWTVWVQRDGDGLPRQVAWASSPRAAERLFDIVASEREPDATVTLWSPGSLVDYQVGEQLAAIGP